MSEISNFESGEQKNLIGNGEDEDVEVSSWTKELTHQCHSHKLLPYKSL